MTVWSCCRVWSTPQWTRSLSLMVIAKSSCSTQLQNVASAVRNLKQSGAPSNGSSHNVFVLLIAPMSLVSPREIQQMLRLVRSVRSGVFAPTAKNFRLRLQSRKSNPGDKY